MNSIKYIISKMNNCKGIKNNLSKMNMKQNINKQNRM